jgi:mono/diheme cytochrome c family protein
MFPNFLRKRRSSFERARLLTAPQSFARLTAALAALALAAAPPFSAQTQKTTGASVTADLPAGPMQARATTACLECHEARIILQQRLSKAAWAKEVDKMTKWGAVVDPADRDALIDYLSTNFSPDKPAYEPPRTSAGKSSSANSTK